MEYIPLDSSGVAFIWNAKIANYFSFLANIFQGFGDILFSRVLDSLIQGWVNWAALGLLEL